MAVRTAWHENGQKKVEEINKDGEQVSAKYWNSKGEAVETYQGGQASNLTPPQIRVDWV